MGCGVGIKLGGTKRRGTYALAAVHWVKAHVGEGDAARRAQAGGYPADWHAFNKGADALATEGIELHEGDGGLWAALGVIERLRLEATQNPFHGLFITLVSATARTSKGHPTSNLSSRPD